MSTRYEREPLPAHEAPELANMLDRELHRVANNLRTVDNLDITRAEEVTKPQEGWVRYFDAMVYDPGLGSGLYLYRGGKWLRLTTTDDTSLILQGLWDQVADVITPGGGPLLAATGYNDGDYFQCTVSGVVNDSNGQKPELDGQTLGAGDQVISISGSWAVLPLSTDYLSSVTDDTAAGVITFQNSAPKTPVAPSVPDDITRKGYVDTQDAADRAYADTQDANHVNAADPHGDRAYADSGDAAHAALQTDPNDVHGSKAYTDAGDTNLQNQLDAHTGNTLIHFDDVVVDGKTYGRRDRVWAEIPSISLGVAYGGINSFTLNATFSVLQGYDFGDSNLGSSIIVDTAAGTITLTEAGLYSINAWIIGQQGNDTKEESIWLWLRIAGGTSADGDYRIDHESVDTDKTDWRSLKATFTRLFNEVPVVLSLGMTASAGLGTFGADNTTFEARKVI